MKSITNLLFFPILALASPLTLNLPHQSRQTTPAQILSVTAAGPGCPAGSYSPELSADAKSINVGFDSYITAVGAGAGPEERERYCDLTFRIQFPLGCSTASLQSTYHGFAQLDAGVTGTFSSQYSISPGQVLTGGNPNPVTISSAGFGGAGNVYAKEDVAGVRVNAGSANQRVVSYTVRTRLRLQQGQSSQVGFFSDDDLTLAITAQGTC